MNTRFVKVEDNKKIIRERKDIVLNRNEYIENPETGEMEEVDLQTFNPTDEMLFANGWEIYVKPEPTDEEVFNEAKSNLLMEIEHYDSSNEVNEFYIQGMPVWLDKATRAGLKLRFEAEIAIGKTDTALWYENIQFPLPLEMAMQMLYGIEVYASACYDNTQLHLANAGKLETLEEVQNYDYRTGYPEKLNF